MEFPAEISEYLDIEKVKLSQDNVFLKQEIELLKSNRLKRYYIHIIKNVEINRQNPNNSYIMWLCNKVDTIDMDLKVKIKEGKTSLPDIDTDYPKERRGDVIKYLQNKYGYDKVAQICNFGTTKGRSALKDVLNAHGACSFDEMNEITKYIPDEAKISDDLQEMIEESGEASIIQWALENNKDNLARWCETDDDGNLTGDFAEYFAQAIRLEGNKRTLGRHASGICISNIPIKDMGPVVQVGEEKEDLLLIGYDMHACESIGLVKLDVLGLATLDRLIAWQQIMETQET